MSKIITTSPRIRRTNTCKDVTFNMGAYLRLFSLRKVKRQPVNCDDERSVTTFDEWGKDPKGINWFACVYSAAGVEDVSHGIKGCIGRQGEPNNFIDFIIRIVPGQPPPREKWRKTSVEQNECCCLLSNCCFTHIQT